MLRRAAARHARCTELLQQEHARYVELEREYVALKKQFAEHEIAHM